jgi:threonine aldolase
MGGGLRQAGIIAAGALYALRHNVERLADDHRRARRLAELIVEAPGLAVDLDSVATNFVIARVAAGAAPGIAEAITAGGVGCFALDHDTIRFVTHLDVDDADVELAGARIRAAMAEWPGRERGAPARQRKEAGSVEVHERPDQQGKPVPTSDRPTRGEDV